MYLGPVVAAQQVLDPSAQHTHLWEQKKGGGGGGTPAAVKYSGVYIPGSRYWLPLQDVLR